MPRMPFAPIALAVFSSVPVTQPDGSLPEARSPSTWTGMLVAVSLAICTVALRTVPHENPSAKVVHSASVLLVAAGATAGFNTFSMVLFNAPLTIRNP